MAESDLVDLGIVYTLTHQLGEPATPANGSWSPTQPPSEDEGGGVQFGVHLEPSGRGNPQARLGYDPATVDVEGLVVQTPYDSLTFPEGVGPGSTFNVTFRGKAGVLTIGAAPSEGIPEVDEELGEPFSGVWKAN